MFTGCVRRDSEGLEIMDLLTHSSRQVAVRQGHLGLSDFLRISTMETHTTLGREVVPLRNTLVSSSSENRNCRLTSYAESKRHRRYLASRRVSSPFLSVGPTPLRPTQLRPW